MLDKQTKRNEKESPPHNANGETQPNKTGLSPQNTMAHLIKLNDLTYSTDGKEWHKKAIVPVGADGKPVRDLTREMIQDILFRVIPGYSPVARIPLLDGNGNPVKDENGQIVLSDETAAMEETLPIFADLRPRGAGLIHLGTHSPGYGIIENGRNFDGFKVMLSHTPHEITTAGTLDNCRKFYVSARPIDAAEFVTANGERFSNFIMNYSSHDGSNARQTYGTATRPVCMNTVQMSFLSAVAKTSVRHTQTADARMSAADKAFRDLLTQQGQFIKEYDRLTHTALSHDDAFAAITGYAWRKTGKPDKISTRTRNTIDDIMQRYISGLGNFGRTAADLFNGFTEYYSRGNGAGGEKASDFERAIAADFGSAADAKLEFARLMMGGRAENEGLSEIIHLGATRGIEAYREGAAVAPASTVYKSRSTTPLPVFSLPANPTPSTSGVDDFASLLGGAFAPKV